MTDKFLTHAARVRTDLDKDFQRYQLPYAVTEDGQTLSWDMSPSADTTHFLATGATGTGRTKLVRRLAQEAARRQWHVRVCDAASAEYSDLAWWPGAQVSTTLSDIAATIHDTHLEMERRYRMLRAGEEDSFEPLVLAIDPYDHLHIRLDEWWRDTRGESDPKSCPALGELTTMFDTGRAASVHLITGIRGPDASLLGDTLPQRFGFARCSLGPQSTGDASQAFPGRGVATTTHGGLIECQVL